MKDDRMDAMHERLCAYLLGESSEHERREVERALARSSELRARKELLEQTIGAVRGAFAGEERLSAEALERLMAAAQGRGELAPRSASGGAAQPGHGLRLLRSPSARAAAAVLVLGGSVWAVLRAAAPIDGRRGAPEEQLAWAEARVDAGPLAEQDLELEARRGYDPNATPPRAELGQATQTAVERPRADPGPPPSTALPPLHPQEGTRQGAESLSGLVAKTGEPAEPGKDGDLSWQGESPRSESERQADDLAALGYRGSATGMGEPLQDYEPSARPKSAPSEAPAGEVGFELQRAAGVDRAADELQAGTFFIGRGGETSGAGTVPDASAAGDPGLAGLPAMTGRRGIAATAGEQPAAGGGAAGRGGPGSPGAAVPSGPSSPGAPPTADGGAYRDPGGSVLGLGALEGARHDGYDGRRRAPAPTPQQRCELLVQSCWPRPHEGPRDMHFRFWGDNAFELTRLDALSTFSVDVDTASYALARRYLNEGHLPEKAQVRTEEFLNALDPDLDPPAEGTFAIHAELAPSLFGGREDRWMLRVGIRGKEVAREERAPLALTFVVDTSGSMRENQRLELVKHAMRLLVGELDARDTVAVVAYSNEARVILPATPATQRGVIEAAIHPLAPGGSTNAEAGLVLGYELALAALRSEAHHRVVFLSDGVANVGETDQDRINEKVRRHRDQGILLNTIGVGMGNHNDVFLEQLANKGDGICDYVDSPAAARRAIVERFTGAFQPIAGDVKVQVEFDPQQVLRYRLLGYENRAIADADFRNDAVDAGEVGAGHQVVALYELERASGVQAPEKPLATVRLRWKAPRAAGQDRRESDVFEEERTLLGATAAGSFGSASPGYRKSVLVAQLAEVLRRSTHARGDSFARLFEECVRLERELKTAELAELVVLVTAAGERMSELAPTRGELESVLDELRRTRILTAECERLEEGRTRELLRELEEQTERLSRRLCELVQDGR